MINQHECTDNDRLSNEKWKQCFEPRIFQICLLIQKYINNSTMEPTYKNRCHLSNMTSMNDKKKQCRTKLHDENNQPIMTVNTFEHHWILPLQKHKWSHKLLNIIWRIDSSWYCPYIYHKISYLLYLSLERLRCRWPFFFNLRRSGERERDLT